MRGANVGTLHPDVCSGEGTSAGVRQPALVAT